MRATVGATAIVQGGSFLNAGTHLTPWMWVAGLLSVSSGIALLGGFLTPVVGSVAALSIIAIALLGPSTASIQDVQFQTVLVVVMAVAVAFLGPGALSVDARIFGRREIIIPSHPKSPNT